MSQSLLYSKIEKLTAQGQSFVLVTMVDAKGSVPQVIGAKMLVDTSCESSPIIGTIGGGRSEKEGILHAKKLLALGGEKSELVHWNLKADMEMACGGEVKLFFEVHCPARWNIAIFGTGHVCQTLTRMLLELDCQLYCIDSRKEWVDKLPTHPKVTGIRADHIEKEVEALPEDTFFLVMTHGHLFDFPVVEEILKNRDPKYLGVIGSKSKSHVLLDKLSEVGISKEKRDLIFSPVGLPFGNNTPAEIAISIAAQLLEQRDFIQKKS